MICFVDRSIRNFKIAAAIDIITFSLFIEKICLYNQDNQQIFLKILECTLVQLCALVQYYETEKNDLNNFFDKIEISRQVDQWKSSLEKSPYCIVILDSNQVIYLNKAFIDNFSPQAYQELSKIKHYNIIEDSNNKHFLYEIFELLIKQEANKNLGTVVYTKNDMKRFYKAEAEIIVLNKNKCAFISLIDITEAIIQERQRTKEKIEESFFKLLICHYNEKYKQSADQLSKQLMSLKFQLQQRTNPQQDQELFQQLQINESIVKEVLIFNNIMKDINLITKKEFQLKNSWFDLESFLTNILKIKEYSLSQKIHIHINSEISLQVFADEERLEEVFFILLNKQVHCCNGSIEIGMEQTQQKVDNFKIAKFYVKNYGYQITQQKLEHLKKKLSQGIDYSNLKLKKNLSLLFASLIAEQLGGQKVEISSLSDQGVEFSFLVNIRTFQKTYCNRTYSFSSSSDNSPLTPSFFSSDLISKQNQNLDVLQKTYEVLLLSSKLNISKYFHNKKSIACKNMEEVVKICENLDGSILKIVIDYIEKQSMKLCQWLRNEFNYQGVIIIFSEAQIKSHEEKVFNLYADFIVRNEIQLHSLLLNN